MATDRCRSDIGPPSSCEKSYARCNVGYRNTSIACPRLTLIDLSQDLIEATMEGPEVDAIYELYADETAQVSPQAMAAEDAVDPEAYDDAMNVDHE